VLAKLFLHLYSANKIHSTKGFLSSSKVTPRIFLHPTISLKASRSLPPITNHDI
jgi:hypothetical protein